MNKDSEETASQSFYDTVLSDQLDGHHRFKLGRTINKKD